MRHSHVCGMESRKSWASEATPTLGSSIKISCDICWYVCLFTKSMYVIMRGHMLKVSFGQLKRPVKRVVFISTIR